MKNQIFFLKLSLLAHRDLKVQLDGDQYFIQDFGGVGTEEEEWGEEWRGGQAGAQ